MSTVKKIKTVLKKILPSSLVQFYKNLLTKKTLYKSYQYDLNKYQIHSDTNKDGTSTKLLGRIIKDYHVIEKGLTMPEVRLGFGKERMLTLTSDCVTYINKFGKEDEQLRHALGVVQEYQQFHKLHNTKLDESILKAIASLEKIEPTSVVTKQKELSKSQYFSKANNNFKEFSNSRLTVRNFTDEEVSIEKIENALTLAQNTPSACNRQSWRTYVYTEKAKIDNILSTQGGNRGFGHLANKVIIVTGEIGVFSAASERNQVFIDGGMYAMNLLYCLHHHEIAACILNCSNTITKDILLREFTSIKDSEVFIAIIAIGIPPDNFKVPYSKRYNFSVTNTFIA